MRRRSLAIICGVVLCGAVSAQADLFSFKPCPGDLNDLPHANYFIWGINWQLPENQMITAAQLIYNDIWDWQREAGDRLYTHLLNTVTDPNSSWQSPNYKNVNAGTYTYQTITITKTDNEAGGDNFAGQGVLIGDWTDPKGGYNGAYAVDLRYDIPPANWAWLADGNFGFGIDADCHYYNSGVEFRITTAAIPTPPVPAPAAAVLVLVGLGLVRCYKRRAA